MMECEICGAEYATAKAMAQHMRGKHPNEATTTPIAQPITAKPTLKTAREIVAEHLDMKLQLRLIKDLDRMDDPALKQMITGETTEKADPMQQFKDNLELMKAIKEAMPEDATTGKSWPDMISEAMPVILEGIKGINTNKSAPKNKTAPVLSDVEKQIIEKEKAMEDRKNGTDGTSETGVSNDQGVLAENTPAPVGDNGESGHDNPSVPEGG